MSLSIYDLKDEEIDFLRDILGKKIGAIKDEAGKRGYYKLSDPDEIKKYATICTKLHLMELRRQRIENEEKKQNNY